MFNSTPEADCEHLNETDVAIFYDRVWKKFLLYMLMVAVVPVNRSGRELDVLESVTEGGPR